MAENMRQFWFFNVRVILRGDKYGLEDCLTHHEDAPLVDFYDTNHINDTGWKRGQFIARYYLETLLEDKKLRGECGLDLDCGIPGWWVPAVIMAEVIKWLETFKC